MPTHDYIIANGTGAAVRADINAALSAIVSLNSSASEPGTMYAYQLWADTTSNLLKIRNSANSAWITLRQLDGDFSIVAVEDGLQATPSLTFTNDLNTGIFRPGNDSLSIVTNALRAITITSTQAVGIQTANPSTALHVAGNARVGADDTTDAHLQIGKGATGNRNSYIDIVGDTTYTDYGLRVIRNNGGADATSEIKHRGTGAFNIVTQEAAPIQFYTTNSPRLTITSGGNVGIGTSSPSGTLEVGAVAGAVTSGDLIVTTGSTTASVTVGRLSGTGSDNTTFNVRNRVGNSVLYVDTGGTRVGIGTTGPGTELHISRATAGRVITRLADPDGRTTELRSPDNVGNTAGVGTTTNHPFVFFQNNTEAARIDESKRLLVGTSTTLSVGEPANALFQVLGRAGGATDVGRFAIARGKAATSITSGEEIGKIYFTDNAGNTFGQIECTADANAGASDFPGRLVFSTTADGSASPTEAMRIISNGQILLNTSNSSAIHAARSIVFTVAQNGDIAVNHSTANGSGDPFVRFGYNGTQIGSITQNGTTAVAYNTSSDYRLKENVEPLAGAAERVMQLKPSRFNFIADPDRTVDGFLAHEAQEVVPECVTGEKDAVDDDGNPVYQGIDQSKLVPLLTAALQEAIGRIETLEAEVSALKGA